MKKLCEITMVLLLVLSLFSALVIMNTPTVKAELYPPQWNPNGYWETPNDDWTIELIDDILYENKKIVVNGNLKIESGGILTLSNVTLQMNDTYLDAGDLIEVQSGGELNVINGSIITRDPITPAQKEDPYFFKIHGKALIENSTIEKMINYGGPDGIEIYSSDVNIKNSTIRENDGRGILINGSGITPRISYSTITQNGQISREAGIECKNSASPIIENCNISSNIGDGIYSYGCSYMEIRNNTVSNNGPPSYIHDGIYLSSSSYNNIINNTVNSNKGYGIGLYSSSNYNTVTNNTANSNGQGIVLDSSSNYNDVINNTCNSNLGFGILGSWSQHNDILNNTINSNGAAGIASSHFNNNLIKNNTINSNGVRHGMGSGIYSQSSHSISMINNSITQNRYGIYMYSNYNNTIYGNNVSDNAWEGIYLSTGTHDNSIINNTIYSNNYEGVYLESSSYNNITDNNVSENDDGIYLSSSSNNSITSNTIYSNTNYGIYLQMSTGNKIGMNLVDANHDGIYKQSSSNSNLITSNYVSNNTIYALYMSSCNNNGIIDNNLQNSSYGAYLTSSNNNILYHNNFKGNTLGNGRDDGTNDWDNGLEGNWWDDKIPDDGDGDGICDTSYSGTSFTDDKPLANEDNDRVLVDDPWFWFIQSGVNFAEPGWTVYATSSTYLENVTINKTLTVIGEDKSYTIIDARGNESVVLVDSTSYVNVSGFTVQNGTYGFCLNQSHFCVLEDNNISNNLLGINVTQSSNINVEYNTVWDNYRGIIVHSSDNNTISNNTIYSNDNEGLWIETSSNYNNVIDNQISSNLLGINVTQSSNITIVNNTITYNNRAFISDNSSLIIHYNNISYNTDGLVASFCFSNASICNNTITHNNGGIRMLFCSNGTIDNNTISDNSIGIQCAYYSSPIITFNNITNNQVGIACSTGSNATIHWNNIHSNTYYDLINGDINIEINATNNWWGSNNESEVTDGILGPGPVVYDPWEDDTIPEAGPQ